MGTCRPLAVVRLAGIASLSWLLLAHAQDAPTPPDAKKGAPDEKTIRALIKELGDESFEKREAAHKRLAAYGEAVLELLRRAAKEKREPEVQERLGQLIQAISSSFFVEVRQFERHKNWTPRLAVTPDGRQVVASLRFGSLRSWNVADGKEAVVFDWSATLPSWTLNMSADGGRLFVGSEDGVARLFDMKTGKLLKALMGHTGEVSAAAFLPDGKRAITGGMDRSLRVWDLDSGREIRAFENVPEDGYCLAVSPDGELLAVGHTTGYGEPATIRLWDMKSGREVGALPGHTKRDSRVCFAADGKTLLSSSFDKTVRLWDVSQRRLIKTFQGHTGGVEGAVFTQDGQRILSVGNESNPVIIMWDIASGTIHRESAPAGVGFLDVVALPDGHHCLTSGKDGVVRLWQWKR
jgi:WD40 repeat protein